MGFNVNFSKRNNERFYLPGHEIRVSRNGFTSKSCTVENDSVHICRKRIFSIVIAFSTLYFILVCRISQVCLGEGININVAVSEDDNDRDFFVAKNPVKRADILDRNGEIIATSLPTTDLYANPKHIKDPQDVAEKLNYIFSDTPYEKFLALLQKKGSFIYLKRNISPAQQAKVLALGIPGLEFMDSEQRVYPHDNLVSHVIGKTNIDNEGISGLEKFMNDRLTTSSRSVYLSLDLGIQNTIRDELIAGIKKFNADSGSSILMDVNTGQVIAMVSYPDFNPNNEIKSDSNAMFNNATKGVYEAGSVFKVFNTALCLESGKIKISDKFDTTKPLEIGKGKITDPHGSHAWLTPEDILVESSNIGSAQEILRVGKEYQREFLQSINMDKELSTFEIIERGKPIFRNKKQWNDHLMTRISYGYGIAATPLHIISAFSAIVNGGIYRNPTLLSEIKPDNSKRILSEKNSIAMRGLLRAVVERGTGKRANVAGYQVMGKTGTADKLAKNGGYDKGKSIATFISGFPSSNPKYSLIVVIDNPKASKETYGFTTAGWNAVPISKNIISAIAPQLNLSVDFDLETQKNIVDAAYTKQKD